MAEDWAADVKKYVPDADDAVVAAIVRYCGIALRTRDASLVSFTDPVETGRVRDNYCRKKLGLTDPDPVVDAAIAKVGARMKGDNSKNRVTVYYLLAEAFGKLGLFGGAAAPVAAAVAAPAPAAAPAAAAPAAAVAAAAASAKPVAAPVAAAAAAAVAAASLHSAPAAAASREAAKRVVRAADLDSGEGIGMGTTALIVIAGLAAIIIGTATVGSLVSDRDKSGVVADAPAVFTTPAAAVAAPAIPEGAGVVAQELEGKPSVSVYFDTAKTDIAPDFATAAAPVKAWLDSHPGARLAVSGFNDPRGDAAMNAELSKNRAKAVAAALAGLGVPADAIDLVKPPETTDAEADLTQARRVEIVVKDAS